MYQYYETFWEYNMTKWQDIKSPWAEIEGLQEIVLDKVTILGILDKYGIECVQCSSGEFTHKLRCPLPAHSNGNERTASMYVSEKNNSFYCFGCSAGGSIVTFLMLYLGIPYQEALNRLATIVGLTEANASDFIVPQRERRSYDQTIMFYIFKSGAAIREYLKSIKNEPIYEKRRIWADRQFRKLDEFLDKFEEDRWPVVKEYYDSLVKHLNLHGENDENRRYRRCSYRGRI